MRRTLAHSALAAAMLSSAGLAAPTVSLSVDSVESTKQAAGALARDLVRYYHGNETGETPGLLGPPPPLGEHWWHEGAVMWATLIDYTHAKGDGAYDDLVTQALPWQVGDSGDFITHNWTLTAFNQDLGLWGMATMLAAERGFPDPPPGKPQWLNLSRNVFDALAGRYDDTACGGGLRLAPYPLQAGHDYKDSFSNGVFFNLGARLARYTGNETYAQWADKTWDWMKAALIDTKTYAIYDGARTGNQCKSVLKGQFSWPSGVFALGAAHMYNHTDGDPKWQRRLSGLIDHGLETFFPDGVATETDCEAYDGCVLNWEMWTGIVQAWYATAAQLAPFAASRLVPALKTVAAKTVQGCAGGESGRACGFASANGSDGAAGASQDMAALAAVSSLLLPASAAPRTAAPGGRRRHGGDAETNGGNGASGGNAKEGGSAGVRTGARVSAVTALAMFVVAGVVL